MRKQDQIKILGVRIDNFSLSETKEKIFHILGGIPEQKFITTLNPEIILKAHRNETYRDILNGADLNICDGFGLKLISRLKNKPIKARLAGADLTDFLLETVKQRKLKILVVVAKNSLSMPEEIERVLTEKHPDISVKSHYFRGSQDFFQDAIIREAEIIFVNFGVPEQEKFIWENRYKFPQAKILVGVGGAFDFLTGRFKRAPKMLRTAGLEWLWRLLQEPKRLRRICRAVIIFPIFALTRK